MIVLATSLVFLLGRIVWMLIHREDPVRYAILATWLLVPVLFSLREPAELHPHYFVILYPAGFIAMAVMLDAGLTWAKIRYRIAKTLRVAIWLFVGSVILWQIYVSQYTFAFIAQHDTRGGYGLPFGFLERATRLAIDEAQRVGAGTVWVIAEGTNPVYEEMPILFSYLLHPAVEPAFLGQGGYAAVVVPEGRPAVYLTTREDARVVRMISMLQGEQIGRVAFPGQGGASVYTLPAHTTEEISRVPMHPCEDRLDAGLTLLGYDWPAGLSAGQTADLITYWAFGDIPLEVQREHHSLLNHLLDVDGNRVAQRDGFAYPERYWAEDHVLMHWFEISLPSQLNAGDYYLLTGLYNLGDGQRSSVLDVQGQTVGDSIKLGPIPLTGG